MVIVSSGLGLQWYSEKHLKTAMLHLGRQSEATVSEVTVNRGNTLIIA